LDVDWYDKKNEPGPMAQAAPDLGENRKEKAPQIISAINPADDNGIGYMAARFFFICDLRHLSLVTN